MPELHVSCLEVTQALVTLLLVTWIWGGGLFCQPLNLLHHTSLPPLAIKAFLSSLRDQPVARAGGHGIFPGLSVQGPHRCLPCMRRTYRCPVIHISPDVNSAFALGYLSLCQAHSLLRLISPVTSTSARLLLSLTSTAWTLFLVINSPRLVGNSSSAALPYLPRPLPSVCSIAHGPQGWSFAGPPTPTWPPSAPFCLRRAVTQTSREAHEPATSGVLVSDVGTNA